MRQIFIFISFIFLLSSCNNFTEVELTDIKKVEFKGFKDNAAQVFMELEIDNPNKMSFTIDALDLKVFANDRYLGRLQANEAVKIMRKTKATYPVNVQIRLANILTGASMFMAMRENGQAHLKVEGTLKAHSFLWKKQIRVLEEKTVQF
ncbi:MAG: hypothetical protein GVY19_10035 [Bacteroidetes bacterium]|jgi:LEA14-like dessication related protein|nr:hypothetical protein [Bacteroidota bacterium]